VGGDFGLEFGEPASDYVDLALARIGRNLPWSRARRGMRTREASIQIGVGNFSVRRRIELVWSDQIQSTRALPDCVPRAVHCC
jgi:hypothetical protein